MSVATQQFSKGHEVIHATYGLGYVIDALPNRQTFVKFYAENNEPDKELIVSDGDLVFSEDELLFSPDSESQPEPAPASYQPRKLFEDPCDKIPKELRDLPRWVVYKLESKSSKSGDIKLTKVPYIAGYPYSGKKGASSTNSKNWRTFAFAVANLDGYDGLGCVIAPPYVAVDIDKVRNPDTDETAPWALALIREINSYAELSPSGTGYHIWTKDGALPNGIKRGSIEMYKNARYFTMSGKHVEGTPEEIQARDLTSVYERVHSGEFDKPEEKSLPASASARTSVRSTEGGLFVSDTSDQTDSGKEYRNIQDLIEEFPGADAEEVERIFRERYANEYRSKWDSMRSGATYLAYSINRAMDNQAKRLADRAVLEELSAVRGNEISLPKATAQTIEIPDDIFYGLAGQIVKKLDPETESHPVGNLVELLSSLGSIIGRCAYYQVEGTRHYTNLFAVKVGVTSKARKGTGKDRIAQITRALDSNWLTKCNASGLGSGEVIVHFVRDPRWAYVKDKATGSQTHEMVDAGISEKRRHISEGEFVKLLRVANKQESTMSGFLRDAWDGKPLRNETKGGGLEQCLEPHISLMCDVTRDELRLSMSGVDSTNGFANRFLWVHVHRTKLLPHGGEDIDWTPEIVELLKVIEFAKSRRRVFMDHNARRAWTRIYEEMNADVAPGIVGAVTSRGEPQVIRLALLYSLLDQSEYIETEHLKAACALWGYCEDSARLIFAGVNRIQESILAFVRNGKKSFAEYREVLFYKNRKGEDIQADLDALVAAGRLTVESGPGGTAEEAFYSFVPEQRQGRDGQISS